MALVVVGAVLWGTTGTAQALGDAAGSPVSVGALRLAIGAAGLVAATGRRWATPPLGWTLIAALAMASYQAAFFSGVARAGVVVGTVVAIGSAPVLAGALAWFVRAERPSRSWWVATALAVAGVALIAGRPDVADPVGVLMAAGAGLAYAVYAVSSKYLVEAVPSTTAMAIVFTIAAALTAPLLPGLDLEWLVRPRGVAAALWLGLGATTLAYVAFASGLRGVNVGTAATLTLAEPATAALLGVALLGERPGWAGWIGVASILVAVSLLGRRRPDVTGEPATTSRRRGPRPRRARWERPRSGSRDRRRR